MSELHITEADIDKAWEKRKAFGEFESAFRHIGIIACSNCGGSGERRVRLYGDYNESLQTCPACNRNGVSHGWAWEKK